MTAVSIWMFRSSLLFLLLTFITGSLMFLNKAFHWSPAFWALLPVHIETAILGWILQFVMGTAYWMFPRYVEGPKRGSKRQAWIMLAALNGGILLSALSLGNPWVHFGGRFLLLAGVLLFATLMWGRVVSYRK